MKQQSVFFLIRFRGVLTCIKTLITDKVKRSSDTFEIVHVSVVTCLSKNVEVSAKPLSV